MTAGVPDQPKIYHIVHVDRLPSIIADGYLWCDKEIRRRDAPGTVIGMSRIKQRRLGELTLESHPDVYVGDCVPFYFCPRSVMLYLIFKKNPELTYSCGQDPIVHLEADLREAVAWANRQQLRWAFTLTNAGSRYFEDRKDLSKLGEIDWEAVQARQWRDCRERKQAEFLVEQKFPWELITRIGVSSPSRLGQVEASLEKTPRNPRVVVKAEWYY